MCYVPQEHSDSLFQNTCFIWQSSNIEVITVDREGVVTGVSNGFAIITATHPYTGQSCNIRITVGQVLENGTYYIRNKKTNLYLEAEHNIVGLNETNIQLEELAKGDSFCWGALLCGGCVEPVQA